MEDKTRDFLIVLFNQAFSNYHLYDVHYDEAGVTFYYRKDGGEYRITVYKLLTSYYIGSGRLVDGQWFSNDISYSHIIVLKQLLELNYFNAK